MKDFLFKHRFWLWPILAMALITPFTPYLDLTISHFFYRQPIGFATSPFYSFLFDFGVIPAQVCFIASVLALLWKKWRASALVMVLTLAIGAGLITHVMLKDHWGRPRPKQVVEFGGSQPFRPYYKPNFFHQPEPSKSFPCGHCTMGFYFFALALVGKRLRSPALFWGALATALVLGFLLSFTRIAQGGHFLSDVLMSALIMWLTAYACDHWIYKRSNERTH